MAIYTSIMPSNPHSFSSSINQSLYFLIPLVHKLATLVYILLHTMKLATILSVLPLALALPHASNKRSQGAFSVMSSRSASEIHLLPMNAAGSNFWLGEKASTYCPETVAQVAPCPKGQGTAFVGNGGALVSSISRPVYGGLYSVCVC